MIVQHRNQDFSIQLFLQRMPVDIEEAGVD